MSGMRVRYGQLIDGYTYQKKDKRKNRQCIAKRNRGSGSFVNKLYFIEWNHLVHYAAYKRYLTLINYDIVFSIFC